LKEVHAWAFEGTYLARIEVPSKCEFLTAGSFPSMKEIRISKENPFFAMKGSLIATKDGKRLIQYHGSESLVFIAKEVETIGALCFLSCGSLCEMEFEAESRLKRIEQRAFRCTGLRSIRIPASVEVIGPNCFDESGHLREVVFEAGSRLREIGGFAFRQTGLRTIRIPGSVEEIGAECFCLCGSLLEVVFEGNKGITKDVFLGSIVKVIKVPRGTHLGFVVEGCSVEYFDSDLGEHRRKRCCVS
jgi:hypothetical protein